MKRLSRVITTVFNVLFWITLISLLFVVIVTLFSRFSGQSGIAFGNYGFGRIVSGSMEPDIPTGSFILIHKEDPSEFQVGDVITFYSDDPTVPENTPVSHAIVAIETDENGDIVFTTKGTANVEADIYPVSEEAVIGRVVFSSLVIGNLVGLTQTPYVLPILILLLFISMIQSLIDVVKQLLAIQKES